MSMGVMLLITPKKGDMLVIQLWDEIYGVTGKNKEFGKYLYIAVKKDFSQKISAEIAGEAFWV